MAEEIKEEVVATEEVKAEATEVKAEVKEEKVEVKEEKTAAEPKAKAAKTAKAKTTAKKVEKSEDKPAKESMKDIMQPKKFKKSNRKKVCAFCANKAKAIDYKDVATLKHYISERGKILPRRQTGTCSMHQRMIANAIKKARIMALLPFKAD